MNFLIIATQSGGCDYTIGCGVDYWYDSADSMEELKAEVRASLMNDDDETMYDNHLHCGRLNTGFSFESKFDSLTIIEVGESYSVPLEEITKEYMGLSDKKAIDAKEEKQRLEYEKLREKFDPSFKKKEKIIISKSCESCDMTFSTKSESVTECQFCEKVAEEKKTKEKQRQALISGIKDYLMIILENNGWKRVGIYGSHVSFKKIRMSHWSSFEIYDELVIKGGGKQTFTWRKSSLEEVLNLNLLPKDASDYVLKHKDVFFG